MRGRKSIRYVINTIAFRMSTAAVYLSAGPPAAAAVNAIFKSTMERRHPLLIQMKQFFTLLHFFLFRHLSKGRVRYRHGIGRGSEGVHERLCVRDIHQPFHDRFAFRQKFYGL